MRVSSADGAVLAACVIGVTFAWAYMGKVAEDRLSYTPQTLSTEVACHQMYQDHVLPEYRQTIPENSWRDSWELGDFVESTIILMKREGYDKGALGLLTCHEHLYDEVLFND